MTFRFMIAAVFCSVLMIGCAEYTYRDTIRITACGSSHEATLVDRTHQLLMRVAEVNGLDYYRSSTNACGQRIRAYARQHPWESRYQWINIDFYEEPPVIVIYGRSQKSIGDIKQLIVEGLGEIVCSNRIMIEVKTFTVPFSLYPSSTVAFCNLLHINGIGNFGTVVAP